MAAKISRCGWCGVDPLYCEYHDTEWGVPVYDDRQLFELLILEGAQAGLSWITVLRKRDTYRAAFEGFDPVRIALYTPTQVEKLMANPGIIRNRLKIESTIKNAQAYLEMEKSGERFSEFLWSFVGGKPLQQRVQTLTDIQGSTPESDAMSKALRKRGFKFVGSTICYAFMQASGMVNDHLISCHRYKPCAALGKTSPFAPMRAQRRQP